MQIYFAASSANDVQPTNTSPKPITILFSLLLFIAIITRDKHRSATRKTKASPLDEKALALAKPKRQLTLAEKRDIREALVFEEIRERGGQIAAETVPLEAKLLLVGLHNTTLRPVTFADLQCQFLFRFASERFPS